MSVYNVLTEVQQCIIKVMPRYQELMKTISKTKFPAQVENLPKPFLVKPIFFLSHLLQDLIQ